ncbi:cytochrome c oxidase assembly protein [Dactylosporangium sp. CA-139114]|uniref:cytochrome c oxidase assembly protein n=1 Tax=Dactylosporangium sp. CA-139114 TaxID=3239931 RepID=UPI003D99D998
MSHAHPAGGGLLPVLVLAGALGYDAMASLGRRHWPWWRSALFLTGAALLAAGLDPAVSPWPAGDFRTHVLQHLLASMLAPLGLVLGAPVTLLLRTVPAPTGRQLTRLLHTRPARLLGSPWTALTLTSGGLIALYGTPLYAATARDPGLHELVHAHMLLAGCLFTWVVAGPDPAPRRPAVRVRLVVLGVAIAVHATLAQLLYAGLFLPGATVPAAQRHGGAALMYYAGDIAELLLAFALVTTWRPVPARRSRERALVPAAGEVTHCGRSPVR